MEKIVFYGTRGSRTLTSSKYMEFGGATTCILFNLYNTHIMVDCGTGINNAIEDLKDIDELHLLISHSHLDHIDGIPTLLSVFEHKKLHIWGRTYDGETIQQSINKLMNRSLWPVRADTYKNVIFHDVKSRFKINDITIRTMDSYHPGGCTLFRIEEGINSYVTAFDFSHLDGHEEKLLSFAKGCTTLIYDGAMSEEELAENPHWGHSTPEAGAKIGAKLGCKNVIITHYGVFDDDTLATWEKRIQQNYPFVTFSRVGRQKDNLKKIVEIGTMLGAEKDVDKLVTKIVESSMDISNCDGGTLYLAEGNKLEFKILINKTKNTFLVRKESPLAIPAVNLDGQNICATAAREKKLINIEDCYHQNEYDFHGAMEYDRLNNYHTQSVLAIPMLDEFNDVIGVIQLINAKNKNGEIVSFKKQEEEMLFALANQAAMAIVNSTYSEKINDLLYGFVKVMSVEIDERTPYNANHTKNMVRFADNFFKYQDNIYGKYAIDFKQKREILMSIWLHDIGKILTPIDIMNKDSRLGKLTDVVETRFERRYLLLKLALANKEISQNEYDQLEEERSSQIEFIRSINKIGFLADDLKAKLDQLAEKTYKELDGSEQPVITKEEHYQLSIIKGTLTKEERFIMEGHVSMTNKFLSQLHFPKYYDNITAYASNHHEFLNGTGYPNHLTEKDLPWPGRLITICDIFEALIAHDRPYKKPMPIDKALSILHEMADKGQLDQDLVKEFEESKCWEIEE